MRVDREFTMPRYSFEYLLTHPTWPTEWKFHMIFIAWADYLQTGNTDLLSNITTRSSRTRSPGRRPATA